VRHRLRCAGRHSRDLPAVRPPIHASTPQRNPQLNIHLSLTPLISLIAGILVLVMPKLLNFIVAIYLIAIGLIGLFGMSSLRLH
jgi:hypothetical protein